LSSFLLIIILETDTFLSSLDVTVIVLKKPLVLNHTSNFGGTTSLLQPDSKAVTNKAAIADSFNT
jgi:hypothetical protein